jgi:hypothetical protein
VPSRDTRPSEESLAAVIQQGSPEDAIIWLLVHAYRVGPVVPEGRETLRRPLLLRDFDGGNTHVWVALVTPGDGAHRTWTLPPELATAQVNPYGQKGMALAASVESWESLDEQARMARTRQTMTRHMPAWGRT